MENFHKITLKHTPLPVGALVWAMLRTGRISNWVPAVVVAYDDGTLPRVTLESVRENMRFTLARENVTSMRVSQ